MSWCCHVHLCQGAALWPRAEGWRRTLRNGDPSPCSRALPRPVALSGGVRHTLRIRGAGAWKMAEGLGANFFLTSGT